MTPEQQHSLDSLVYWLEDNVDSGHGVKDNESDEKAYGIFFDNDAKVYSPQALEAVAQLISERDALFASLTALNDRAKIVFDQSATHDGLTNCDLLAHARTTIFICKR